MAFLEVSKGAYPGQIVELVGERMVIGRHPSCEVVIDNAAVSRYHAQILQSHGNYYLEDLRSRNQTYLNDIAVEGRTELHEGDAVQICDVSFAFHLKLSKNGESSWLLQRSRPTKPPSRNRGKKSVDRTLDDIPARDGLALDEESSSSGHSSIISTLNAKSTNQMRLNVKPESKLRAVLKISRALAQTLQLDDVLERTLDELFKIYPQADEAFVLLKQVDSDKLVVSATKTRAGSPDDSVRVSRTIVEQAMQDGEAILSHDALQDARFDYSESLDKLQIRSMMCVPLVDTDGRSLGVIQLDTKDLRQQFSQDDLDLLVAVAFQIALAVENAHLHQQMIRQRDLEQKQERKQAEMELAVQVQLDFLPSAPPQIPGYEFFDFYEAAMEIGGDYFDYIELPGNRVAVPVGDVAGKGIPAALLMAKLSSSARFEMLSKGSLSEALDELNANISSSGLGHRFITLAIVLIDANTNEVTVANAGHPPPYLRRHDGTVVELGNEIAGTPLGVVPDQHYETTTFVMQEGESIVLFTDGITEAMNTQNDVYGRKRLSDYVATGPRTAKELAYGILSDVEKFSQDGSQHDDICLVCIHRQCQNELRGIDETASITEPVKNEAS